MVFFVLGGIAAAAALQEIYEQVFELPHRGMTDVPHRLAWLAVLIGTSLLTGWTGPWLHHAGGAALLAAAGLVWIHGLLVAHDADLCWRGGSPGGALLPGRLRHRRAVRGHGERSSRCSSPPW